MRTLSKASSLADPSKALAARVPAGKDTLFLEALMERLLG